LGRLTQTLPNFSDEDLNDPQETLRLFQWARQAMSYRYRLGSVVSFFARRCFQLSNLATQSDLDSKRVVNPLRAAAGGHESTGCSFDNMQ